MGNFRHGKFMSQKILVTGTQGFLGSNLVEFLYSYTDYKIYSISRTKITKEYTSDRFVSIEHDLLNPLGDDLVLMLSDVDYVVHLAGSSNVQRSLENPYETFQNNVIITTQLLEFVRKHIKNLKQFLFFSTAESFGPSYGIRQFKETDRSNALSPYAATKAAAAEMCKMYFNVFKVPTVVTYVMNVYGKNQALDKFVPKMVNLISKEELVILHANNGPDKRNYLHVDDISDAIHFLIVNGVAGENYNIISDRYTDNLEIATIISNILQKELKFELASSNNHHTLSLLDGTKLTDIGWRPKISLETGLRKYINNV